MRANRDFAGVLEKADTAWMRRAACVLAVIALLATAAGAVAQNTAPAAAAPDATITTPESYTSHHSIDLGGRIANLSGSGAMYDTLVNLQSGPRILGESYTLRALPGKKHSLVDDLSAFGSGFGGDPNIFTKLDVSKSKYYEFSGLFRRDRSYSDYDLLANPNIPNGQSIPIGPSNAPTARLTWPAANDSPVMFNIVRRMTDSNLTLMPFATFTVRLGYSHFTMEGPTLSPSYTILKYNALLRQNERNGSDDYLGAIDWKPRTDTKITIEMQANHYKYDTFFTLNPSGFLVQEADGTPAYLGNYTSFVPYGISACNTTSMGSAYTNSTTYTILSPANGTGANLPIINPACAVVTSYTRSLPTRTWTPTETLRFLSGAIHNVTLNGNVHYTRGRSDLNSYYENAQGLNTLTSGGSANGTANRSITWTGGNATVQHSVIGADVGMVWHANSTVSIADQITYSSTHEPGNSLIPTPTALADPTGAGNGTINFGGTLVPGTTSLPHGINGTRLYNYYGQEYLINNLTASWDASVRAQFALTYRYSNRNIGQGIPHQGPIPDVLGDPVNGTITINENAAVLNAALRPTQHWQLNGTAEIGYADSAFTAVGQRQFRTFRMHTQYRPKVWATLTGSFSDRERHNNTNNNADAVSSGDVNYNGPINHVDHNRIGSVGVSLAPSERYSVDFNYSYSDVYAATNICFSSGATAAAPGVATLNSAGALNLCSGNATWFARDFMDAPTQFAMAGVSLQPVTRVRMGAGYTISSVNGSRFFNDARDVNGSMVSAYQSPYLNLTYTFHPGFSWRAEYNYYGYGEGGPSGATMCSTTTSTSAVVVPCSSFPGLTAVTVGPGGFTAPRNFHANNITFGIHYEF